MTAGSHSIRMPALRAAATLHRDQSVRDRLAAGWDMHAREAVVDVSDHQEHRRLASKREGMGDSHE